MPPSESEQSAPETGTERPAELRIGVDVGGTFTDLVAFDGHNLHVVKLPSTPPEFHKAVIEAIRRVTGIRPPRALSPSLGTPVEGIVHGSTVATNALLQRAGEPVAFVTTEGFRDMLLIGRQNRPSLYALRIVRSRPLTPEENWFTVGERVGARGEVVTPLEPAAVDRLITEIQARGLRHVAVCLLFSFVNPAHEQMIGERCRQAGLTVSLSSEVLPEFREYERASTTVINASLRPTVEAYLAALALEMRGDAGEKRGDVGSGDVGRVAHPNPDPNSETDVPHPPHPHPPTTSSPPLRIMHSGGGTLSVAEAGASAARLVLSGPAGGVMGAAFVAGAAGFTDVITYDMGGTSTDVAVIVNGRPQWTTGGTVGGLPLALPAFDIVTVGAGGGSVACLDAGGALRVGPRSAGAVPGPACYARDGTEPTVTDANLLLGRILPDAFAGGTMRVEPDLAHRAVTPLAAAMGKTVEEAALGIVRVAEQNMSRAVRAVTSRRGLDPRGFTLVSFGGAGGLHACAVAESLDIPRVLVPPYCGVLSALGMVVAPPVADASKTVIHLGDDLDDARLAAEFGFLNLRASEQLPVEQTAAVEAYADARFHGQSYEVKVRVTGPSREMIEAAFVEEYRKLYGHVPHRRAVEIVTLRIRRIGHAPPLRLPALQRSAATTLPPSIELLVSAGSRATAPALSRTDLIAARLVPGPLLLIDAEATTFVPPNWTAKAAIDGSVVLEVT